MTDTTGPVTLVLCGNHRIDWSVEKEPNVQLDRILLTGALPQRLVARPNGTIVETYFGKDGFAASDPRDGAQLRRAEKRILDLVNANAGRRHEVEEAASNGPMPLNLRVSSFAVAHHADGEQIVGPEDGSWRMQVVSSELDRFDEATTIESRPAFESLEALRFHAVHHGTLPRGGKELQFPLDPFVSVDEVHWNQFSTRGPLIGKSSPIHRSIRFGATSESGRWMFTGTMAAVTIRDSEKRTTEQLDLTLNKEPVGHLAGIGFDEKRNRLLISASRGLFEYSLEDRNLERLRMLDGLTRAAFTYSSSRETAFAIRTTTNGRGEIHSVERFNPWGVRLPSLKLTHPITLGNPYNYGYSNLQLIAIEDHLVVLRYQHQRNQRLLGGNRIRTSPSGRVWVIRLGDRLAATGELVHEGTIQPSLVYREISSADLESRWNRLAERYPEDLESSLWAFASGGESSLQFLKSQYRLDKAPPSDEVIADLVKDLDDARFSVRETAFKSLQATTSRIAPALETFLASNQSTEVRERLQQVLANWKQAIPQTDEEVRLVRGLEVLQRIGSVNADEFLSSLTGELYSRLVRSHAMRLLEQDERSTADVKFENPAMRLQQDLFVPR